MTSVQTKSLWEHRVATIAILALLVITNLRISGAAEGAMEKSSSADTAELSVAPAGHREYPSTRPAWLNESPGQREGIDLWPVTSTPCRDQSLCEASLKAAMRGMVDTYIDEVTGTTDSSEIIVVDDAWIEAHRDPEKNYVGAIQTGDDTSYESATMLLFTADDREWILRQWREHQMGQRMAALGLVGGFVATALVGFAAGLSLVTKRAEQRVVAS